MTTARRRVVDRANEGRVSAGWRGRKAAILSIVALCCSAVTWLAHFRLEGRLIQ